MATGEPPRYASGNGFEVPGGRFKPVPVVSFEPPGFEVPDGQNGEPWRTADASSGWPGEGFEVHGFKLAGTSSRRTAGDAGPGEADR